MKEEGKQRIQAASSCYTWGRRGQLQSVWEGEAQDSSHLWEEEDQPTRPPRRPYSCNSWSKRDAKQVAEGEKQDFLEGLHPLGRENKDMTLWRGQPLPKQKKKLHIEQEPARWMCRPCWIVLSPLLEREREKKTTLDEDDEPGLTKP